MEIMRMRIVVTLIATVISIVFIIFTYIFPLYAAMLLSIEVVFLPTVYIVGNLYIEKQIETYYREKISTIIVETVELNRKYYKLKQLYRRKHGKTKKSSEP